MPGTNMPGKMTRPTAEVAPKMADFFFSLNDGASFKTQYRRRFHSCFWSRPTIKVALFALKRPWPTELPMRGTTG